MILDVHHVAVPLPAVLVTNVTMLGSVHNVRETSKEPNVIYANREAQILQTLIHMAAVEVSFIFVFACVFFPSFLFFLFPFPFFHFSVFIFIFHSFMFFFLNNFLPLMPFPFIYNTSVLSVPFSFVDFPFFPIFLPLPLMFSIPLPSLLYSSPQNHPFPFSNFLRLSHCSILLALHLTICLMDRQMSIVLLCFIM